MFNNLHKEHQLVLIGDIVSLKKQVIQKDFEELEGNILPSYINISTYVQKKYAQISTAIINHAEKWHDEIERLVNELRAELDEMKTEHLDALRKHSHEIQKEIKNIQDAIHTCENLITSNDVSLALNYTSVNEKYRNLPSTVNAPFPTFIPMEIETHKLRELFGCISKVLINSDDDDDSDDDSMTTTLNPTEEDSSTSDKQLLNEPETVTTLDTGYESLNNVACLSDEQIWTTGNDSSLKLISVSQGSTLKSVKSKSGNTPEDIAVTKDGDLVYTDYKDKTVNIVTSDEIEEVIRFQNWKPRSVCSASSGDLLVILDSDDYKQSKVVAYSGSTKKYTIQYDETGKPL
ncbi:uncharacterized protein LOC133201968 [Saccostrea echinata]|uniref:uncharacterized protein LOC133201968 n=1 Tax=Saccostrea echinata TaxID=191078 RepID=UPI002A810865|nr:uncharacterized protein LOC133201968 [Saccostrea echinata]